MGDENLHNRRSMLKMMGVSSAGIALASAVNLGREKIKEGGDDAKLEIENQKKTAIAEVKNQSSLIALAIAERVIKKQLTGNEDQETLANELIENIKLS